MVFTWPHSCKVTVLAQKCKFKIMATNHNTKYMKQAEESKWSPVFEMIHLIFKKLSQAKIDLKL